MKKELDFWRRFATAVALAWAVTALLFSLALTKATGTVKDRIREANDKTQTCRQDAMSYWYDELSNCKSSLDVCWETSRRLAKELRRRGNETN